MRRIVPSRKAFFMPISSLSGLMGQANSLKAAQDRSSRQLHPEYP
ncbi:hypothetical protein ACFO1S_10085 [Cohnella boryungensis]|uniref:Uncharacterized protein n=1 Tax=Cohnella boryungensis TaxID=768479 RepID=A0ABV8S881_9BACL